MAVHTTLTSLFTDIANAIRNLDHTSATIQADVFPDRINVIKSGGKAAATYNPSTSVQTIAAGQYLLGAQTIAATTGTARANHVLSGYTFNSAGGIGLTGTIPTYTGSIS